MTIHPPLLLLALLSAALAAAEPADGLQLDERTRLELTAGLAQYQVVRGLAGTCRVQGGGVAAMLVQRLAEDLARIQPGLTVGIKGGGARNAIAAMIEGEVEVAALARPLRDDERASLVAAGIEPVEAAFANDALAVFVHHANPLPAISLDQLERVYGRTPRGPAIETWDQLGVAGPLAGQAIQRHALGPKHGTHGLVRDLVLGGGHYRFDITMALVPGNLRSEVGASPAGIGLASVMFGSAAIRAVAVGGADGVACLPGHGAVLAGTYPLCRPQLLLVARRAGRIPAPAEVLVRFGLSQAGQRLIASLGAYPLTVAQQAAGLKALP
jgi:phosphate transport system substrate-binding protein